MSSRRLIAVAVCAAGALLSPTAAQAAPPLPFGHACTPTDGVLFCPTTTDGDRVPAFDGVPLDVDVTLPAEGDGPFPTIIMLHGYGGDKTAFVGDGSADYSNLFYARRGYAVINHSARGFGRSCGKADSRGPGCERGFIRLADHRYEVRDAQDLLGALVDQGIARPDALGATGVSYGGGQSMSLAFLRNRTRLPDGSFKPWTSPAGKPLSLAAAYPRWPWSDLASALVPNGRYRSSGRYQPAAELSPVGVPIKSYVDGLFAVSSATGFLAPAGAEPSADQAGQKALLDRGEPYGAAARASLRELQTFHGASGLLGSVPAPLLLQSGWTDDLFPVGQSLRAYNSVRLGRPRADVSLQLGDLGHSRGANHPADTREFSEDAARFFDAYLKRSGTAPAPGGVKAFRQVCPSNAASAGTPFVAPTYDALSRRDVSFGSGRGRTLRATGSDAKLAEDLNPLSGKACRGFPSRNDPGSFNATGILRGGLTLLGLATVRVTVRATGSSGMLAARLWDVDPRRGTQRIVDRGVLRLRRNERGRVAFELNGNAYRFAAGHRVKIEILSSDAPKYKRSKSPFTVRVSNVRVTLPVR